MLVAKDGRLAVWVGTIPRKAEFNAYLKETYDDEDDEAPINAFCADMRESFYDHDFVFGEWYAGKPKPVAQLLDGWRQAHTFSAAVLKLAKKAGIAEGNTILIAYDHELKPAKWPVKSPVRFLGNLSYSDEPAALPAQDLAQVRGHSAGITRLCFSPDGKTLVSGGSDGTLMAWDAVTGRAMTPPEHAFKGSLPEIYTLAISADGRRCLAATMAGTCVWDSFPTAKTFSKPIEHFAAKAIGPDGKTAFGCELKRVTARDLATGKPVKGLDRAMVGADFVLLPKDRIATVGPEKGELLVWNTKTGKRMFAIDSPLPARDIAASPGGTLAVTYSGTKAVVFDLEKRTASQPVELSADILDILVPTEDVCVVLHRSRPLDVRALGTGKSLRTLGAGKPGYWRMYAGGTTLLAIEADRVNVEAWNIKTGKSLGRYPNQKKAKPNEVIDAAAVSPDGETLAVALRSGEVRFLTSKSGKLTHRAK
jgi:WD40 repeat protein